MWSEILGLEQMRTESFKSLNQANRNEAFVCFHTASATRLFKPSTWIIYGLYIGPRQPIGSQSCSSVILDWKSAPLYPESGKKNKKQPKYLFQHNVTYMYRNVAKGSKS